MSHIVRRVVVPLVAALACIACNREAGSEGSYAVRDSSGVQIVSNPASVTADSTCPVVDPAPVFTIGGANAEGPYDVQRVGGARQLRDGTIVLLNGATSELRFFDAAGHYLHSAGRKGSGPGEFQSPYQLLWYGRDTLMVQDFGTGRIALLGTDGTPRGDISLQRAMAATVVGRLPDGTLLFATGSFVQPGQGSSGRQRSQTRLVRLSPEGAVLDTIGEFPGSENVTVISERSASVGPATFGRSTVFALMDSLLYLGDNDSYRVQVLASGRRLVRVIGRSQRPVPVTTAMVDSVKARQDRATSSPQWREIQERMWALDKLPATLPAYRNIALDADRWLWVRPYSESQEGSLSWDVFDTAGRLRCAVPLPADLRALEIGPTHFLGEALDADGVEQVRYYRVHRGGRSPS
jgi:hypothetical protein